jgi:hypothetical protein
VTTAQQQTATAVLHVGGMYRGSENAVVEAVLRRRPGVLDVEGNAAAQTVIFAYETGVNRPVAAEDPAASST